MKTTRIIIGCIFAAIAIAVNIGVARTWVVDGGYLILAMLFYTLALAAIWYTIDSSIREANK